MKNVHWGCALLVGFMALGCSSPSSSDPAGSAGTSASNSAELCDKQYDAMIKNCSAEESSREGNVHSCQADQRDYQGIGCKSQYDSWLVCTTQSGYDCNADTGCEAPQNSYFGCQSQSVQRTGCVRLEAHDASKCTDASKPYAFGCVDKAPSQCTQVVFDGGGIWCCPQL